MGEVGGEVKGKRKMVGKRKIKQGESRRANFKKKEERRFKALAL